MRKIGCLIIITLLLFAQRSPAQKIDTFRFVVEDKQVIDGSPGMFWGFEYEFSYRRVWTGKASFKEEDLLSRKSSYLFKIQNGNWYWYEKGRWQPFYLMGRQLSPVIKMAGTPYRWNYQCEEDVHGIHCIKYRPTPIGWSASHTAVYWFSPEKGIIKITGDVTLVREDVL